MFSALGFYPVCPASDEYVIGSPLFKHATIHLENGKKVVLDADNNSGENVYIKAIKMNGKNWEHNFFRYSDLMKGANITFDMASQPEKTRGTAPEDKPYSLSKKL